MIALLLAMLAGCGRPAPTASDPPDAVFPHTEEFLAEHGTAWKASGGTCVNCHSPKGAETSSGPACAECHAAYPHEGGIEDGAVHGALWIEDASACNGCHGLSGELVPAGSSPGQCTGCHSSYPHDTAWASLGRHGAAVVAHGGTAACEACHGAPGSASATALCGSCHAAYPHPAGWGAPDVHGPAWLAGGPGTCGTGCHDGAPPVEVPGCVQCHDVYPHPAGWTTAHVPAVQARSASTCAGCHPDGSLKGPRIPNTCASACHGDVP